MSPIYLYLCEECGNEFEVRRYRFDAPILTLCPECKGNAHLKVTACSFTFGFRLTERSHEVGGPKDEVERDV